MEIMITTAHRVYFCATHEEFLKKKRALNTLNIAFNFYWKIGGEFVNMSYAPKDVYKLCANK